MAMLYTHLIGIINNNNNRPPACTNTSLWDGKQGINVCWPNLIACAGNLAGGNATVEQQLTYARSCVEPGFQHFQTKFDGELNPVVSFFKRARMFSPAKMKDTLVDASTIDDFAASFSSLSVQTADGLKAELPTCSYKAAVDDVDPSVDAQDWWERLTEDLSHWSTAFKLVLLVQPSSAAAERFFSLLQNSFSQRQSSSLEDSIETSLMLQYNR